jgi:hypothetical protein
MGLTKGRLLRIERKRVTAVIKDKFHLKKRSEVAFLRARNDRCVLAAGLLPGAFVFLDSPLLGTTMALVEAGVEASRLFPVNGCDKDGFCEKARNLGVHPTISMFDAAPSLLEDVGDANVQLCYNDGTHGDPDLVWADMSPWLSRLLSRAYLSFTFSLRSRNAVPVTGKFGLVTMLAQRGFEPPGGWKFLDSAFTFDGRVFNVQMTRGVAGRLCEKSGLCRENGYSLGKRYETAKISPAENALDLRAVVRRFVKKCPLRPYPMHTKTPHVSEWEDLRRRICSLGARGERRVLEGLGPKEWVTQDYLHWLGSDKVRLSWHYALRFPKRLLSSEARHWAMVGRWVADGLMFFDEPNALVVLDHHLKPAKYRAWLAEVFPKELLGRMLCVGDSDVTPAVKASTTRGTARPGRVIEGLSDLLLRERRGDALFRFGPEYSMIFLPLFSAESHEEVKTKVGEALTFSGERSALILSLRSASPLNTVAWVVRIISYLARKFGFKLADFCRMNEDGSDLVDYSRIVTVILVRGM